MLILKTGASVLSTRLPVHCNTTLSQATHSVILSSLNQTFHSRPILDILTSVSQKYKDHHQDFEVYRELQKLVAQQGQEEAIAALASGKAWDLDKWKFMPMVFETYRRAPEEVEWFVMVEGDTSFSWGNAIWWLSSLDSKKPRYMGAPAYCVAPPCSGQLFAHGGSGIFWSRSAVERLIAARHEEGEDKYDARWEEVTEKTCCGDVVLAEAFQEVGVHLTKASPMVQGSTPLSLTWSQDLWCRPPITFHHVAPPMIASLYDFSTSWTLAHSNNNNTSPAMTIPYTYSDIFTHFIPKSMYGSPKRNWDNKSRTNKEVFGTEEECRRGCEEERGCLQWIFKGGREERERCLFGEQFTIGEEMEEEEEEGEGWVSGWVQGRVEELIKGFGPC